MVDGGYSDPKPGRSMIRKRYSLSYSRLHETRQGTAKPRRTHITAQALRAEKKAGCDASCDSGSPEALCKAVHGDHCFSEEVLRMQHDTLDKRANWIVPAKSPRSGARRCRAGCWTVCRQFENCRGANELPDMQCRGRLCCGHVLRPHSHWQGRCPSLGVRDAVSRP